MKHSTEFLMPLLFLIRIILLKEVAHSIVGLLLWMVYFPVRYVLSVSIQKVVTWHDLIALAVLRHKYAPSCARRLYHSWRRHCKRRMFEVRDTLATLDDP